MKLSLGFSPCPNDTFIFDALVHGFVDTEGLTFEPVLADVEALNRMAFQGQLDITKLSYHAYGHLSQQYALLTAGSALGRNCGPLLIANKPIDPTAITTEPVAIPGRYTTANFLLGLAYPNITNKVEYVFSDIEDAIIHGEVAAGLIIHENRFTYAQKGLLALRDLGEFWESSTGLPIPLGGIAVHRRFDLPTQQRINRVLASSVRYALERSGTVSEYVQCHAQSMDPAVMMAHIQLYVNDFTVELGPQGRHAVEQLYARATALALIPPLQSPLFVEGD